MRSGDPNVLLVVLDSVKAANTSLHGHHSETTPFLASFADRATHYQECKAPAPKSLTSHASLFTGLAPEEHGLTSRDLTLKPGMTVWADLRADGYETAVFSANPFVTEYPVGLADAFDDVFGRDRTLPYPDAVNPWDFAGNSDQYGAFFRAALASDAPVGSLLNGAVLKLNDIFPSLVDHSSGGVASDYVDLFAEWHAERTGPWAACINLMDAHTPYEPQSEHDRWSGGDVHAVSADIDQYVWAFQGDQHPWYQLEMLGTLYDGAIRQADAAVEQLVSLLADRDDLDETLVVVTSDHGEGFGERSPLRPTRIAGHGGPKVHEAVLHVPLVVKYPGQTSSRATDAVVSLTDFREAVCAVREGVRDPSAFETPGPVVASATGIRPDGPVAERASQYVDDLSPYFGRARAVYEDMDMGTHKYMTWEENTAVRTLGGDVTLSASQVRAAVDDAFDDLSPAGVTTDDHRAVDDAAKQRLKDLGYA